MRRGDVYDADLDPVVGSEQAGLRPVVIVSRNAINDNTNNVIAVPFTTFRHGRRLYPNTVVVRRPNGGLTADSVALSDQVRVLSKLRLRRLRGTLPESDILRIDNALLVALDLPGQQ